MAYNAGLADRLGAVISNVPHVTTQKMFGVFT